MSSSRSDSQRAATWATPKSSASARAASAQALMAPTLVPQKMVGATQAGRDGTEGVPQYAHLVRAARSSARKDESERAGALGSHV